MSTREPFAIGAIPNQVFEAIEAKVARLEADEEAGRGPYADAQTVDSVLAYRLLLTVRAREDEIRALQAENDQLSLEAGIRKLPG